MAAQPGDPARGGSSARYKLLAICLTALAAVVVLAILLKPSRSASQGPVPAAQGPTTHSDGTIPPNHHAPDARKEILGSFYREVRWFDPEQIAGNTYQLLPGRVHMSQRLINEKIAGQVTIYPLQFLPAGNEIVVNYKISTPSLNGQLAPNAPPAVLSYMLEATTRPDGKAPPLNPADERTETLDTFTKEVKWSDPAQVAGKSYSLPSDRVYVFHRLSNLRIIGQASVASEYIPASNEISVSYKIETPSLHGQLTPNLPPAILSYTLDVTTRTK